MDGAFGTVLHGRGVPIDQSFDAVNLTNPALVAEIHRGYIDAGSDLIETNTFGANRFKLMEHGQQQQVEAINRAAVAIARRVIAGSFRDCLLYTSDAAGERSSVDLGGRRILKKKNNKIKMSRHTSIHAPHDHAYSLILTERDAGD